MPFIQHLWFLSITEASFESIFSSTITYVNKAVMKTRNKEGEWVKKSGGNEQDQT